MQASKEHPVTQVLTKLFLELVGPALQEGGLNFGREEFLMAGWMTNSFRVTLAEYVLAVEIVAAPGENEDDPMVGQLALEIALNRPGPVVTFVRRSDETVWRISSRGTLCLPNGHPLGELAHHADHLGFEAKRMEKEVDDKTAFRLIAKVGHIVEYQSL